MVIKLIDNITSVLLKAISDIQFPPIFICLHFTFRAVTPLAFMQETRGADISPSWSLQCTRKKRQVWLSALITSICMSPVSM